jgi:hypothetical protein
VVLCDLEGLTQVEAARELGCGEATLRRRLAGAHERLRARLGRSDLAVSVGVLVRTDPVPAGWIEVAARAAVASEQPMTSAAGRLAADVLGAMTRARYLKRAAWLVVGVGLATAWALGPGWRDGPRAEALAQPRAQENAAEPGRDAARVRWVHLKTDTGEEIWANLDDGRQFSKAGNTIALLEANSKHDLYTYEGRGSIVKTRARSGYTYVMDRHGRQIPPAVFDFDWNTSTDLERPRRATEPERKTNFFMDFDIEIIGGRRLARVDQYGRDALGQARLERQCWVDPQTRRLVRRRERLAVALQSQFKKEFAIAELDYPENGPADLFALGVPRGTPVVDKKKEERLSKWDDLAPEVRRAIEGQVEAIRRFPRHFRAVAQEFEGELALTYWSAPDEFIRLWCEQQTSDVAFVFDHHHPRSLMASHQDLSDLPLDLKAALSSDPRVNLPADRIAAWFPFDRSAGVFLEDGKRTYDLYRLRDGAAGPYKIHLHVLSGGNDTLPDLLDEFWRVAGWRPRGEISAVPPRPDTPPGCLVIRTDSDDRRNEFTIDPARDFLTVRRLEWSKDDGKWYRNDRRAVRFRRLPGGSWYVAAWERRQPIGLAEDQLDARPEDKQGGRLDIRRLEITPLEPDQFPKDLFDGDKFMEAAKKAGAVIEADALIEEPAADEPGAEKPERAEPR